MNTENDTTTADLVSEAFKHWSTLPPLFEVTDLDILRSQYERQTGPTHWFDAETLRFFGSRNLHVAAPGVTVECQTGAPEGCARYAVTAWVVDETAESDTRRRGRITPQRIGAFWTLNEARGAALVVSSILGAQE